MFCKKYATWEYFRHGEVIPKWVCERGERVTNQVFSIFKLKIKQREGAWEHGVQVGVRNLVFMVACFNLAC